MSANTELYRNLKSGMQYNNAIPKYLGITKEFDKQTDNSNTFDTLNFMSQWAKKYAYQYKDLAPMLRGSTTAQSVQNIYDFLYQHHQYNLDGETQNLYSPSAAWHFRKKGFDCKTFSILASILLSLLKIPNAFRMVKQNGVLNGAWSHVYTIAIENNKYYVIDATRHKNTEVQYTEKHDLNMNHIGLAYPAPQHHSNCKCKSHGLGNPVRPQIQPVGGGLQMGGFDFGATPSFSGVPSIPSGASGFSLGNFIGGQIDNAGGVGGIASGLLGNLNLQGIPLSAFVNIGTQLATGNFVGAALSALSLLKNVFGKLFVGASAFNGEDSKIMLQIVTKWYEDKVILINQSIAANDMNALSIHVAEFWGASHCGWLAIDRVFTANNWNSPTDTNINIIKDFFRFYINAVNKSLDVYMDTFFVKQQVGTHRVELLAIFPTVNWVHPAAFGGYDAPKYQFQAKQNVRVPDYKVTKYVTDKGASFESINPEGLIRSFVEEGGMKLILDTSPKQTFSDTTQPATGTNVTAPSGEMKQNGFGIVPMLIIASIGLGVIMNKDKILKSK